MSFPYVGEIRMFGGSFEPTGWALCDGRMLSIAENETLFQLIGTTYGGDGDTTFQLPDLRGRIPIHAGQGPGLTNRIIGERAGAESVTLTNTQIPIHNHPVGAAEAATGTTPKGAVPGAVTAGARYFSGPPTLTGMANSGAAGGSQPHENMAPYLCVSFIISLFGVFPSVT